MVASVPRRRRNEPERTASGSVVAFPVVEADDATLVAGIVAEEPAALAALFERYSPVVHRLLVRTLGTAGDVEDLAQETFLVVVRRCATLRDPTALRSFVVSVAIRLARNELRKRTLRSWIGLGEAPHLEPALPAHDAELAEGVRRIYAALDRLGIEGRIAFVLRRVEGYEIHEAAEMCGCSQATFKRRLARCEQQFEAICARDPLLKQYLDRREEDR